MYVTLQVAVVIFTCCLAATFDVCLFIWLDAISFHLENVREMVQTATDSSPQRHPAWQRHSCGGTDTDADKSASSHSHNRFLAVLNGVKLVDETSQVTVRTPRPSPEQRGADPPEFEHSSVMPAPWAMTSPPARDAPMDTAETLARAEQYYADIRRSVQCGSYFAEH